MESADPDVDTKEKSAVNHSSMENHQGVVVAFDAHIGLGRIRSEAGDEMLFHCAEITDGSRSIDIGQRVRFRAGKKFDRPEAFDVSPM